MRILVISHSYFPTENPRAFRWTAICEHWAQAGIAVDVVCAYAQGDLPKAEKVKGVNIYRARDPSQRIRSMKTSQGISCCHQIQPSKTNYFKTSVTGLLKRLIIKFRWPDRDWLWIVPAYFYANKLLQNYKYSSLITVSHPFSSHLIGKIIKRNNKKIRWLVDIGDPFAFAVEMPLNNVHLYRRLNHLSERDVFEQADCVAVTNERTAERYVEFLGQHYRSKIHVIGPLTELDPLDLTSPVVKNSNEITLMFAGNLINPVRKPEIFLSWVVNLLNTWNMRNPIISFDLYGDSVIELQRYMPEKGMIEGLRIHGRIPKVEVVSAMMHADILVNCGNITDYQLPSKIYEYMATGKPIINYILNPRDISLQAMKDYPDLLNVLAGVTDVHSVIEYIEARIQHPASELPDRWLRVLKSHSVNSIADSYLEALH